ncbi:MFS transporter [Rhodococcus sp. IEGM 1408]|uniref:MFS transporter n=1 Tax=Rhodococcus sp. IEGM 1408 TaxID=3082220 RepID=UPI002954AA86|nr:MFS transporter [Rhodococcus sp. IEGM 1408]MDV8000081.1 MFS transporter [Rhodococcus sp. IEGM 1408]
MTSFSVEPAEALRGRLANALRESDGLGRLSTARLAALLSEGIHQAALGGIVLFSPEAATTPATIAGGFAVMLLPYSIVGPFAAAALDRWDRRVVVAVAALVRTLTIVATIVLIAAGAVRSGGGLAALFGLSLVAIGLGRLINTGMTAAMPRVVPDRILAATNSVLVTVGSVVTAVGAVAAFAVLAVLGAGDAAVSWTLVPAVITAMVGVWAVLALPARHLGPDDGEPGTRPDIAVTRDSVRLFAGGLAEGVRAARSTALVWVALAGVTLARAAFGITTMLAILLLRDVEAIGGGGPVVAGMGGFGLLSAAVAGGMGLAAVAAPWAIARTRRILVVAAGSAVSAAAQLAVGPTLNPTALIVGAVALGLGAQVVKLVADNAMQTDVPDARRGGVFALQDALFNSAFVVGMIAVLPFVPADGRSVALMVVPAALYAAAVVLAVVVSTRSGADTDRPGGH